MLTVNEIFFAAQLASLGWVVTCVLMMQDGLLEWWYDAVVWIDEHVGKWAANPLGLCEKCFTGQLALWVWLATHYEEYTPHGWAVAGLRHAIFCAVAIILVLTVKTAMKRWK